MIEFFEKNWEIITILTCTLGYILAIILSFVSYKKEIKRKEEEFQKYEGKKFLRIEKKLNEHYANMQKASIQICNSTLEIMKYLANFIKEDENSQNDDVQKKL